MLNFIKEALNYIGAAFDQMAGMHFLQILRWAFVRISPLLDTALIVFCGYILTRILASFIKKALKRAHLDISLIKFIDKTVRIVCYIIVALSALANLGIPTTGIIAAFSAAGVAVALALKDSLSNIAGGIILLIAPRFYTGDYIKESEYEGTVVSVDLMHTTIRTADNIQVAIPNGVLMNSQIVNYSREEKRRLEIIFPIAYEADPEKAIKVIKDTVKAHEYSLSEPEPFCRVSGYDSSAVNISMRVWVKTENFHALRFDLLQQVREGFIRENIEIPYNKLDVNIINQKTKEE